MSPIEIVKDTQVEYRFISSYHDEPLSNIEKYGLKGADPNLVKYFGWGIISLGSFNILLDYIRKPKKNK